MERLRSVLSKAKCSTVSLHARFTTPLLLQDDAVIAPPPGRGCWYQSTVLNPYLIPVSVSMHPWSVTNSTLPECEMWTVTCRRTCWSGTLPCVVVNSVKMHPALRWECDWSCLKERQFSCQGYEIDRLFNPALKTECCIHQRHSRQSPMQDCNFTNYSSVTGAEVFHIAGDVFIVSKKNLRHPALAVQGSKRAD